jgi:hypothetical protein
MQKVKLVMTKIKKAGVSFFFVHFVYKHRWSFKDDTALFYTCHGMTGTSKRDELINQFTQELFSDFTINQITRRQNYNAL